jgi:hypothetical protein
MNTFCGYRTRLLPQARAERFARCLQANPNFANVTVKESATAKNRYHCHYVAYQPASPGRAEQLRAAEAATREERAEEQAGNYEFWADPDSHGLFWTLNLQSQEVYETTIGSCTCPDHTFRGAGASVPCKHIILLRTKLEAEAEQEAEEVEAWVRHGWQQSEDEAAVQRQFYLARMNADFPEF